MRIWVQVFSFRATQKIMGTFVSRKLLYQMPGEVIRERAKKDYGIDLS